MILGHKAQYLEKPMLTKMKIGLRLSLAFAIIIAFVVLMLMRSQKQATPLEA